MRSSARLRKADAILAARISECDRIIAFRNVLAHGYDSVDDCISWDIVENKLPVLRRNLAQLIAEGEATDEAR
jgi:uncharacterized protein YutE (UPF0331/DUF86 family)